MPTSPCKWLCLSYVALLAFLSLVRGDATFGNPPLMDCLVLWRNIMKDQGSVTRWFDEEQLIPLDNLSWPGLHNTLSNTAVQLPQFHAAGT